MRTVDSKKQRVQSMVLNTEQVVNEQQQQNKQKPWLELENNEFS